MKSFFCLLAVLCPFLEMVAQTTIIQGKVISKGSRIPLDASFSLSHKSNTFSTADGSFTLRLATVDTLVISHTGYLSRHIPVGAYSPSPLLVILEENIQELDHVTVSTGYQLIPKERATGSFVTIDSVLINRRVSTGILSRLEGIASGVLFNKNTLGANEKTGIAIRGRSTIDEKVNANPLIILDNFPYEGDLANLNPNDVENITLLKDAAAASIWGARAGNGVIVITTKKGKYNQPLQLAFSSMITTGKKPDLFYSPNFLSAPGFIETEQFLFSKGFYDNTLSNSTNFIGVTPVVEILAKKRSGQISSADADAQLALLSTLDIRNDISRYVYRESLDQQYALNLRGGGNMHTYSASVGYDRNLANLVRNSYERLTLGMTNSFRPVQNLELSGAMLYTRSTSVNNNPGGLGAISSSLSNAGSPYPYAQLAGEDGTPLPLTRSLRDRYKDSVSATGYLDWQYRPLEEIRLSDNSSLINHLLLRANAKYSFRFFSIQLSYQKERQVSDSRNRMDASGYFVRNLVNSFYNPSGANDLRRYPVPKGAILDLGNHTLSSDNARAQLNFDRSFGQRHSISAIAGFELKEIVTSGYSRRSYGYTPELGTAFSAMNFDSSFRTNPSGAQKIPSAPGSITGTTNRFVSWYLNAAYTYKNRYTVSISGRQDGTNLFGVISSQRITPLGSVGLAWKVDEYLKLRATYGFNGNVYNASAYLTGVYQATGLNSNNFLGITAPPNPELRWERVQNINIGLDFRMLKGLISGSLDLYRKKGLDLVESAPLAPSSGFTSFKGNAASNLTHGIDLVLNLKTGIGPVQWSAGLLVNYVKDRVTHFNTRYLPSFLASHNPGNNTPAAAGLYAVEGRSLFGVYSYRFAGLDATGDPQGYLNGAVSKDYLGMISNTPVDSLVYSGSSRPTLFGSLLNGFSWKRFSLSFNISYKLGYFFRRNSLGVNYNEALNFPGSSKDYYARWQQAGDERATSIPSLVYPSNTNRSLFYLQSEILVEKADHIRLQDISISYSVNKSDWHRLPFGRLQFYLYANNIGLLWKANHAGLDPDATASFSMPDPKTLSIGIKANL